MVFAEGAVAGLVLGVAAHLAAAMGAALLLRLPVLQIPEAVVAEIAAQGHLEALALPAFGGLNKENRNDLRTHQKQCG